LKEHDMPLDTDFARRMAQATQLTRTGRLSEAVAAIQAALGRPATTPEPEGLSLGVIAHIDDLDNVVDIEAREVAGETRVAEPFAADAPAATSTAGPHPSAPKPTVGDHFVSDHHRNTAGGRDFKLYIPPARHGAGRPLVVMLHGCTQHPDDFAAGTRMNTIAADRGFYVLYPAQTDAVNPSRCWNWFKRSHQRRDAGEPAILAGMVREVIARHRVDPDQVYVAGLSAGGAMAAILGETYPDLFAAVGVHSGLPPGAASDVKSAFAAMKGAVPAAPVRALRTPTIVFHGDRDATVHPVNGERVMAASAMGRGAAAERSAGHQGRPYTRHVRRDADGLPVAEHWVVHGAGHAWSGGSAAGTFTDPAGPCATTEMLRFFADHRLDPAR
jgi:poly(hydroxyalkanoate) depolymerase family esterase